MRRKSNKHLRKLSDLYTKNRICDDKLQNAAAMFSYIYNKRCNDVNNEEDSLQMNSDTIRKANDVWRARHNDSRNNYQEYLDVRRDETQNYLMPIISIPRWKWSDSMNWDQVLAASGSSSVSLKRYNNLPFLSNLAKTGAQTLVRISLCNGLYAYDRRWI